MCFKKKNVISFVVGVVFGLPSISQAALHDRGSGLLYDDVLNVTWLQDANYAWTSGYDDYYGYMTWEDAKSWTNNLVYHDSVRNVDYSDWRLPSTAPVNGASWNYSYSVNGTTDTGYNITSQRSELAYMFYVNLGLKGYFLPNGVHSAEYGLFSVNMGGPGPYQQRDVGLVKNLQQYEYWFGTSFDLYPQNPRAFTFDVIAGYQSSSYLAAEVSVWAVRDGDVAAVSLPPVPEPETYAMLLVGLGAMVTMSRRRKK